MALSTTAGRRWVAGAAIGLVLVVAGCTVRRWREPEAWLAVSVQAPTSARPQVSPGMPRQTRQAANTVDSASKGDVRAEPPSRFVTAHATPSSLPSETSKMVTLTVVYDNNAFPAGESAELLTSWGFACWVETGATTVLFDTGGDGAVLMHNLHELGWIQ